MHEKRVGLRQREHIRGHLWHRYSVTVDQVMVANVTLTNSWLQLYQFETLVSIAALIAETLSYGNHDRSHKIWNFISTERHILHTGGAAGMLLHIQGNIKMEKLESSLLS